MYKFDAKKIKNEIVYFIRDWFMLNGNGCNAVIGISGGKDSSVVAGLLVEALGQDRVKGILLPNGIQSDIQYSLDLVNHLGINHKIVNIETAVNGVLNQLSESGLELSEDTVINVAPRIRMTTAYAYAQSINGRVIGTGNLSENHIGFFTLFGDGASACEPIGMLTVSEVKAIGRELGLPEHLIEKVPTDGLSHGLTDEEKFGFTYDVLDEYLRTGVCEDITVKAKIDRMHFNNLFKFRPMPMYQYCPIVLAFNHNNQK